MQLIGKFFKWGYYSERPRTLNIGSNSKMGIVKSTTYLFWSFDKILLRNENVVIIFDATFQNKVSGDSSIFLWENVKRLKSSVKCRSKSLTASIAVSVVFLTTTSV